MAEQMREIAQALAREINKFNNFKSGIEDKEAELIKYDVNQMKAEIVCEEGLRTFMAVSKQQWAAKNLGDVPRQFLALHEYYHQVYGGQENCEGAKFTYQDSF